MKKLDESKFGSVIPSVEARVLPRSKLNIGDVLKSEHIYMNGGDFNSHPALKAGFSV